MTGKSRFYHEMTWVTPKLGVPIGHLARWTLPLQYWWIMFIEHVHLLVVGANAVELGWSRSLVDHRVCRFIELADHRLHIFLKSIAFVSFYPHLTKTALAAGLFWLFWTLTKMNSNQVTWRARARNATLLFGTHWGSFWRLQIGGWYPTNVRLTYSQLVSHKQPLRIGDFDHFSPSALNVC